MAKERCENCNELYKAPAKHLINPDKFALCRKCIFTRPTIEKYRCHANNSRGERCSHIRINKHSKYCYAHDDSV